MWLERASARPEMILHVARHMRAEDHAEIFATRRDNNPVDLAADALACGDISWVGGGSDGVPITAFGCAPMWLGVWSMWLFATDDFPRIGLSVTRFVTKTVIPSLIEGGAHRLEARSMEGHMKAQRWLETIGASREATLKAYGREGQDFHVYTWPCSTSEGEA